MIDPFHNLMTDALGKRKPHDPKPPGYMGFFNVADSKKEFDADLSYNGYKRGDSVIYVRCCFHSERTPSLAIYVGTNGSVRKNRPRFLGYKCYGCGAQGSLARLERELRGLTPQSRVAYIELAAQEKQRRQQEAESEPLPF